ncbi:hypothetical protein KDH_23690 [Dictyobacter sp. S3.2.2.5]|uniref:DUF4180 domain-containing protein n=2 Tax=Dictyobacter halimunensis TaxID=3026934 RepID=A0ABQ6FQF2_9CHLR|nr:hypothetical protein KDH_23690 [Dictyobacter sp. S3.2.2.5]
MADTLTAIQGVRMLACAPDGAKLTGEREAVELIGETMYHGVEWILLPVERLDDNFFQLKNRLAGHIIQKFVTYRRRLVILGDITSQIEQSSALTAFIYETNRGNQVWFLKDLAELTARLEDMQPREPQ